MTTDKHVDPAAAPKIIEEENSRIADIDIPAGAVRFELTAEEIDEALSAASSTVCPLPSLRLHISFLNQNRL